MIKPIACMNAKTVVGPTNFQTCSMRSFDSATDAGEVDTVCGAGRSRLSGS